MVGAAVRVLAEQALELGAAEEAAVGPAQQELGGDDRGLFRRAELKRLLDEHVAGRADHGHRLWCLCMLELWQRTFLDAGRPQRAAA